MRVPSPSVSTWGRVPLAHAPAASDLGLRGPCSEATRPHDLPLRAEQHREGSPEQEVLRRRVRAGALGRGARPPGAGAGTTAPTAGWREEADLKGRWASGRSAQSCTLRAAGAPRLPD